MASINKIGEMIKRGDVRGLLSIFNNAGDWDTRETAVVATQNMIQENRTFNRVEMIRALRTIERVCKAETAGGTFRTNCLGVAQDLLDKLNTETRNEKDTKKVTKKKSVVPIDMITGKPLVVKDILGEVNRSDPLLRWLDTLPNIKQRKGSGISDSQKKEASMNALQTNIISISSKSRKGKKLQRQAFIDADHEQLLRFCVKKASPEQIQEWREWALSLAKCGIPNIVKRALLILKVCQESHKGT